MFCPWFIQGLHFAARRLSCWFPRVESDPEWFLISVNPLTFVSYTCSGCCSGRNWFIIHPEANSICCFKREFCFLLLYFTLSHICVFMSSPASWWIHVSCVCVCVCVWLRLVIYHIRILFIAREHNMAPGDLSLWRTAPDKEQVLCGGVPAAPRSAPGAVTSTDVTVDLQDNSPPAAPHSVLWVHWFPSHAPTRWSPKTNACCCSAPRLVEACTR